MPLQGETSIRYDRSGNTGRTWLRKAAVIGILLLTFPPGQTVIRRLIDVLYTDGLESRGNSLSLTPFSYPMLEKGHLLLVRRFNSFSRCVFDLRR